MKHTPQMTLKKIIKELQARVNTLQKELKEKEKIERTEGFIAIKIKKSQARFKRIEDSRGKEIGQGNFYLKMDVTAPKETIYLPLSIASGKRATGFIYQIEGTAEGKISKADISAKGDDITKVTLGTLLYTKIPAGKTATVSVLIETRGKIGKKYKIVINRINYKLHPTDTRYKRYEHSFSSKTVRFR